ncbi:MAG: hypothetical protein KBA72_13180 [Thermoanaerobaculia bacterium]|nr:hypothetical protein [Thermoanaerobaculia bacterium]
MMKPRLLTPAALALAVVFQLAHPGAATAQAPTVGERVAALKASLAASQAALMKYEWIETTVVSLKGEEKSRQQNRCYHGADGGVQKVPVAASPAPKEKRGLRGAVIANKKEELTDYMQQAVALVKSYVPPSPALIQAAHDGGRVSLEVLQPGKRVRLNFRDYAKPGDSLGVEIDPSNNSLLGLTVKSYLEGPADAVTLDARFAQLTDGSTYADAITLGAPAKGVNVAVDNSGYRKTGN